MDYEIVKNLLISLVLGFAIGMQRSMIYRFENGSSFSAGSRTFALVSLLGYLSVWLNSKIDGIALLTVFALSILLAISYYLKATRLKRWGMTTEITLLLSYIFGALIGLGMQNYAVFIAVLVIIILEIKPLLQKLESHIDESDVDAVVLLLAMSFVVLPILPDKMIGPYHLFNPYKTWLMAVIIAGVSFVGYVAVRILGQKHGVFLTGAAGGLVSSTAVSISLSKMFQHRYNLINNYAGGIAIASTFMYLRVLFEVFVIDPHMAYKLIPAYLGAGISGLIFTYWLYKHSVSGADIHIDNPKISKNPLQLSEAIKFGILFGVIYGAVAFVQGRYGNIGVYLISLFSGLTDVDAITLSLSQLARDGKLMPSPAMIGIVIASVTNSLVKLGIVYWLGGARLGWKLTEFFIITLGMMGVGLWWSIFNG